MKPYAFFIFCSMALSDQHSCWSIACCCFQMSWVSVLARSLFLFALNLWRRLALARNGGRMGFLFRCDCVGGCCCLAGCCGCHCGCRDGGSCPHVLIAAWLFVRCCCCCHDGFVVLVSMRAVCPVWMHVWRLVLMHGVREPGCLCDWSVPVGSFSSFLPVVRQLGPFEVSFVGG